MAAHIWNSTSLLSIFICTVNTKIGTCSKRCPAYELQTPSCKLKQEHTFVIEQGTNFEHGIKVSSAFSVRWQRQRVKKIHAVPSKVHVNERHTPTTRNCDVAWTMAVSKTNLYVPLYAELRGSFSNQASKFTARTIMRRSRPLQQMGRCVIQVQESGPERSNLVLQDGLRSVGCHLIAIFPATF